MGKGNKEEILVITSLLLFVQGYLYVNIIPVMIGIGILLYILTIRISFNPEIEIAMINPKYEFVDNEYINLKFKIKNNSKIPYNIEIKNNNFYFDWDFEKTTVNKQEEIEYGVKLTPKKTGSFNFKDFEFRISDINNIYFKDIKLNYEYAFEVYPSIDSLKKQMKINKNIKLGKEMLDDIKMGVRNVEFEELRDYVVGEDYRFIDWNASSKKDRLIVKTFLSEKEAPTYILVDVSSEFRRELQLNKSKVKHISAIVQGMINSVVARKKQCIVIFFDNNSIKETMQVYNIDSVKKTINKYLKPIRGFPNLNFRKRKENKLIYQINKNIVGGNVIIITDGALRYNELINLHKELKNKNTDLYIISLNSILYLGDSQLNKDTIPKIYKKYIEREQIINQLNYLCPTIDIGPKDKIGGKL
ncbi:DUF58 domain-containing protein [Methanococcus aeolicus]|uniref:DUF58 domain-containing protein n=1 Tax=Methanococcus aeolicus (strain ATCC BAA-1280 / DSM 17508 / OCM 812 / Nankai-3) TaxID=419665 RepID=A6UU21_META3|nr:DUF58 domain-containing protein [Methanococcus aeolicus]ABR55993.1 protein of unknown function DUF58 [Methanococcus aeolicus Nankai-3]UXM85408.1 DUF58 domain-containing protein [Methanococcus aeolicus]